MLTWFEVISLALLLNHLFTATSYFRSFAFFSSYFGVNYFDWLLTCDGVFESLSSLSFPHLAERITSARRLERALPSLVSRRWTSAGHLFYLRAVTFRCHVARTILQLSRFQYMLWSGHIGPSELSNFGQSSKCACAENKIRTAPTSFVLRW